MLVKEYRNYKFGQIDSIEDHSIPHGASSDALNWLTKGDHIELSRGRKLIGTEDTTANGRISGLHIALRADGKEVLYKTFARKIKYFDETYLGNTLDWIENGTNVLPVAASNEDISFANYNSLAGAQCFLSSPNSGLWKIMTANPGSITDLYDASKNYKFYIKIKQNRMTGWNRVKDPTGIYMSYIDAAAYTTVAAEAIGSSGSTHYTGTLAFKAAGTTRTCFGVTFTDTFETFTDNYNGVLTGSAGGTGTINYTTGAYDITFNASAFGSVTADYQWENSNNTGIGDFTHSGTRTAGQGVTFRQDDGGGTAQSVASYGDTEYCLHEKKTWALTLTADDTNATNLIFREKVGIPNKLAACATGDGVFYVDDTDKSRPFLSLLTLQANATQVIPLKISLNLDLEGYLFDAAWAIEWNEYIAFGCRTSDSTVNNRIILYNKTWKALDYLGYYSSNAAIYNGVFVIGDSLSNNVYEIFSGVDDDESTIDNHWDGALSDLEISQLKKTKRYVLEGNIGPDQQIDVYVAYDNADFVLLGSVEGSGSYVDKTQSVDVGAVTVGRTEVGGGGTGGAIPAYHYMREFRLNSDRFNRVKVRYIASALGYASVTMERYKDIRAKGNAIPSKYRTSS